MSVYSVDAPGRDLAFQVDAYIDTIVSSVAVPAPATLVDLVRTSLPWLELRFERLAAREGRQDALLCPRRRGGFLVVLDPEPSPADVTAGRSRSEALDWRLAHELGHTFFFCQTESQPRRWRGWCPQEEEAADRFAGLLLSRFARLAKQVS